MDWGQRLTSNGFKDLSSITGDVPAYATSRTCNVTSNGSHPTGYGASYSCNLVGVESDIRDAPAPVIAETTPLRTRKFVRKMI